MMLTKQEQKKLSKIDEQTFDDWGNYYVSLAEKYAEKTKKPALFYLLKNQKDNWIKVTRSAGTLLLENMIQNTHPKFLEKNQKKIVKFAKTTDGDVKRVEDAIKEKINGQSNEKSLLSEDDDHLDHEEQNPSTSKILREFEKFYDDTKADDNFTLYKSQKIWRDSNLTVLFKKVDKWKKKGRTEQAKSLLRECKKSDAFSKHRENKSFKLLRFFFGESKAKKITGPTNAVKQIEEKLNSFGI